MGTSSPLRPRVLRNVLAILAVTLVAVGPAAAGVSLQVPASDLVPAATLVDPGDGSTLDNDASEGPPAQLTAGVAEGLLRVPVGTPLGGYLRPPVGGEAFGSQTPDHYTDVTSGSDPDGLPVVNVPDEARAAHSPFANASPPSRGYHDALVTKAVALHDGSDLSVIVKIDAVGMLDELAVAVAEEVQSRTGRDDVADGLIMTATHSHHGPGAMATHSTRYFFAAMDVFQPEILDRAVSDIADVVEAALSDMVPARFGYVMGREGNESPHHLNSWRRPRDPWTAERVEVQEEFRRRLGVMRVDEIDPATGAVVRPMGVLMNYAAHGIMFDVENHFFSGGGMAGAERWVEGQFDQPVVSMFVQGASGDVSPRADANGRGNPRLQRMERFGELLGTQVMELYAGIDNFDTTPDIEVVSQRIALNRETLGYAEGEYPHEWGAAQCNNDGTEVTNEVAADLNCVTAPPPDAWDLADNGHAENASFLPLDTRITVAQIGGARVIAQPGEPVTEFGLQLVEASSAGWDDTFLFGYAQDHIGYLLPDSKEYWLLGRVEGTTTFWGWKQGARMLDATVDLMDALDGLRDAPANELEVEYVQLPYAPAPAIPGVRPGRVVTEPASIDRFETTTFRFEGGDPVADLPTVVMERRVPGDPDGWEPVPVRGNRPLDAPFEYGLAYRLAAGAHVWEVAFEAPKDWPALHDYRFSVTGQDGVGGTYEVVSGAFTVSPARTLVVSDPVIDGDTVSVMLAYTAVPGNRRLVDAEVPADRNAPVRDGQVVMHDAEGPLLGMLASLRYDATDDNVYATYTAPYRGSAIEGVDGFDQWGNRTP